MKHSNINFANDVKVLGRVVSIAVDNKVAEAEQVFDTPFKYNDVNKFHIDENKEGLDQYEINRLFKDKIYAMDNAGLVPDEETGIINITNPVVFDASVEFKAPAKFDAGINVAGDIINTNGKIVTPRIEATDTKFINLNADHAYITYELSANDVEVRNLLHVIGGITCDGQAIFNDKVTITAGGIDVTGNAIFRNNVKILGDLEVDGNTIIAGDLIVKNHNILNEITNLGEDLSSLESRIADLEACCIEVRQQLANFKCVVILNLGQGVTASNSTARTELPMGGSYSNTFSLQANYENLSISVSPSSTKSNVSTTSNSVTISDAKKEEITINVSATYNPPAPPPTPTVDTYTISWTGNGTMQGQTSPVTKDEGSSWSGTAVANSGYTLDSVTVVSGSNATVDGTSCSVSDLVDNVVFQINATKNEEPPTPGSYRIHWLCDEGATIYGEHENTITIQEGYDWPSETSQAIVQTVGPNYAIDKIIVDGEVWDKGVGIFFLNVTSNHEIRVTTIDNTPVAPGTFKVTHVGDSNSSVSNTPQTVTDGNTWNGVASANSGYEIQSISYTMGGQTYTVTDPNMSIVVTGDVNITVTTKQQETPPPPTTTYSITYNFDEHVKVAESQLPNPGANGNASGFKFENLNIGDSKIVYVYTEPGYESSFSIIPENSSSSVTYQKNNLPDSYGWKVYSLSITIGASGSLVVNIGSINTQTGGVSFWGPNVLYKVVGSSSDYALIGDGVDWYGNDEQESVYIKPNSGYTITSIECVDDNNQFTNNYQTEETTDGGVSVTKITYQTGPTSGSLHFQINATQS